MSKVMVDPSLLLSSRSSEWVRENRSSLVISGEFMHLVDEDPKQMLRHLGVYEAEAMRTRERILSSAPEPYAPRNPLPEDMSIRRGIETVEEALFKSGPLGAVYAEQWRFLNTESWLLSARRWFIDQLHKKGAVVVEQGQEMGRKALREYIGTVIPGPVPSQVDAALFSLATVKWIVVGGPTVGLALVSAPASALAGISLPPVVRAFDP
ncbi:MAG: hypothetical protein IPK93_09200 [Solirubrobacterales bacterium]|nr:hypothetical protein [Solirubrobacterales bacterium]